MPNQEEYHITFTDNDGTAVGIKLCDSRGREDPGALSVQNIGRTAIKMAQGGTSYSDFEPPYTPTEQKDMSGGTHWKYHELDKTKFYDSMNMDTSVPGHVFLGPRPRYTMTRKGNQYVPGPVSWQALYGSTAKWRIKFTTPAGGYTAGEVWLWLKKVGSPNDLHVQVNNTSEYIANSVTDTVFGTAVKITLSTTTALSASTEYQVNIVSADDDASNHWLLGCHETGYKDDQYSSANGSWTDTIKAAFYRVTEAEKLGRPHFFEYKGQLFTAMEYDGGHDLSVPSKVFINGEQGIVTDGSKYLIEDSTLSLIEDEHQNSYISIYEGMATTPRYAKIEGNNATKFILKTGLGVAPDPNARTHIYNVIGSDKWTEITGHDMKGAVTDVISANGLVYFCMGDYERAKRLRRYFDSTDTWTDAWANENWSYTFIEIAPDSDGNLQIWVANNGRPPKVWQADMKKGDNNQPVGELNIGQTNLVSNSDCEEDSTWTQVGSPTTHERSTGQTFSGTYSWKVTADATGEGTGQTITTEADETYIVGAHVYVESISSNGYVQLKFGGNVVDQTKADYTGGWVTLYGWEVASGTSNALQIVTSGTGTFYVDDVDVLSVYSAIDNTGKERITNLIRYGEPERLWVLTDGGIYKESNGYFLKVPLREFESVRDERNGREALVHDVYLYTTLLEGLERYYRSNLDDMGPNRDEGFPANRRGDISFLAGYPPRLYAGIDAKEDGYSSVYCYNGVGWHELYRAPCGERIRGGVVQAIPGDDPDRLWFGQGSDILWIPILPNPKDRL